MTSIFATITKMLLTIIFEKMFWVVILAAMVLLDKFLNVAGPESPSFVELSA